MVYYKKNIFLKILEDSDFINDQNKSELSKESNIKKEDELATELINDQIVNKSEINEIDKASIDQTKDSEESMFKRFLNYGVDGITTNPNYKLLALLVILFVNLSLFIFIGNLGKAFLRNSGLLT
tara:strand:- start:321 stop:695 length:375 start_codon:yes stop_codon:yes gene_type:complete